MFALPALLSMVKFGLVCPIENSGRVGEQIRK